VLACCLSGEWQPSNFTFSPEIYKPTNIENAHLKLTGEENSRGISILFAKKHSGGKENENKAMKPYWNQWGSKSPLGGVSQLVKTRELFNIM